MVVFDSTGRVVEDLIVVSNATRTILLNAIPSIPSGSTAIGQGKSDLKIVFDYVRKLLLSLR